MPRFRATLVRFLGLFRRGRHEAGMNAELQAHLDGLTERNIAKGMSPVEARYAALREFGGVEQVRESARDQRRSGWVDGVVQDLRYAVRQLRRTPGFTVVAVVSLALGIGANTAIFSALDRTLLRPLPVPNPDELIRLHWLSGPKGARPLSTEDERDRTDPATGRRTGTVFSMATFEQFRAHHPMLAEVFAFTRPPGFSAEFDDRIEAVQGQVVSGGFYTGLGATVLHGRTILPDDDRTGAAAVVVISHRCWQLLFGGDIKAIGKTILVNRAPVTIIGITGPDFVDPISVFGDQLFSFPLTMLPLLDPEAANKAKPGYWWLRIMGRLQPGVTPEQAAASLQAALQSSTREGLTVRDDPPLLRASPGGHGLIESRWENSNPLLILMGMVGLVLLAACTNVANLLLARGAARQREIAVRLALGASRRRLIRQLLTESVLLAVIGAVLGLLIALWAGSLPFVGSNSSDLFDRRVFAFTSGVALLTGVVFGLVPALRATRLDLVAEFQGGTRRIGRGSRSRLGQGLLVVQVALSLVLLVGAGLFLRTLRNLRAVEIGFDRNNLLLFSVDATTAHYQRSQFVDLHERIAERIRTLPGIRSVSFSSTPVLGNNMGRYFRITVLGRTPPPAGEGAMVNPVGSDFFETFEIPALRGRLVGGRDHATAPMVAVVNRTLADKFFSGRNPIGEYIQLGGERGEREIIGVVRDVKQANLRQTTGPTAFVPFAQSPAGRAHFAVRTVGEPAAVVPAIRNAVREVERNLPLDYVRTQERQIEGMVGRERAFARLSGFFGGLALGLAGVGLYGLMSYAVLRRTGEIGLRMALGALPANVLRMFLRESLALVLLGTALGLGGALAATRFVANLLYGLPPTDPTTYAAVSLLMILVGLLATLLPARRAAKVDPMVALRTE